MHSIQQYTLKTSTPNLFNTLDYVCLTTNPPNIVFSHITPPAPKETRLRFHTLLGDRVFGVRTPGRKVATVGAHGGGTGNTSPNFLLSSAERRVLLRTVPLGRVRRGYIGCTPLPHQSSSDPSDFSPEQLLCGVQKGHPIPSFSLS